MKEKDFSKLNYKIRKTECMSQKYKHSKIDLLGTFLYCHLLIFFCFTINLNSGIYYLLAWYF